MLTARVHDDGMNASGAVLASAGRGGYRRSVSRPEIHAFAEDHLDAAGTLLAGRHRAHRVAEPLLSERFENADAARGQVAALWAQDDASGAVAVIDGHVAGYLLGTRRDDGTWGANVWVEAGGYAADEPEVVRDLYAFSAQRWVDAGRVRHYALIPTLDDHVAAWFRLSFGAQQAHGITEVHDRGWPPGTRRAEHRDIDALIELAELLSDHQARAPVLSGIGRHPEHELRALLATDIEDETLGELVYERDGRVVASFAVGPVENGSMHGGLAKPDGAALLGFAASLPDVRGSGAGVALTQAAFAWAYEKGYATMVTDWREPNLAASRFWPARGFRRSFLRLYRSIP
jgi:GNAT superfamily N-acetyltransferase